MDTTPRQRDVTAISHRLRDDRHSVPWPQRQGLVRQMAERMDGSGAAPDVVAVLFQLADDPKWEVRSEVAECMAQLPDGDFARLAARLADDANAFVRNAAGRAMARRRCGQASAQRRQRRLANVQGQYANIERMHGTVAANKAMQMAERLYDVLVGATVHDMRNIITPLKSGLATLQARLDTDRIDRRAVGKTLAKMQRQADMLHRMMDDMRAYSQTTPESRTRERIGKIVQDAHAMVLDAFGADGQTVDCVSIALQCPENLTADISRDHIVRALANVIKNAYEAFATGPDAFAPGEIAIAVGQSDHGDIEITVR